MPEKCSGCGAEIPEGSKLGACPKCLMSIGLDAGGSQLNSVRFDSFGDYELLEEIARGGMGVVYKACQKSLNRLVAVKLLLFGPRTSAEFIRRFRIEASSAAALQHPNIVAIHEVGVHEGEHFLVMDYVDGRNLAQLAKNQPLSAQQAVRYLRKVAEAIHHAHEKGILHRDLKPSNVLIDSNDEPRVTDFGLAKRLDSESQPSTDLTQLTLSGHMLGSPGYMPPEQAIGARGKMSRRSDIYSMGAMLYHLLTGRPPFGGSSMADVLYQVLHQEPVSPRLLNPDVPLDLETICLKCLEKEPERRYRTAQELADELGRFLKDEPICARPVSRTERAWRWCRRHPQVAGLGAGIALLLFVVALGTPVALFRINREWRRAELNAGREATERQRAQRFLTRLEVKKAQELFAADDASGGLAYLARALRDDPSHQAAAERMLTALTQRGFTLPCLPPLPHDEGVTVARFSPDGRLFVTAAGDGSVQRWDAVTAVPIGPLGLASGQVNDIQFSPDGAWVVIAAHDKVAIIFDVRTGEQAIDPLRHNGIVHSASFSHDGELILTTSHDGSARVWEAKTGRLLATMQHEGCVVRGRFSPDGRRVATASLDNTARVWLARTGQPTGAPLQHDGRVRWVEFSPDGRRVLTASDDKTAGVWDADRGTAVLPPLKHPGSVVHAEFSPDGNRIVTTCRNTKAWIWDARNGLPLTEPLEHGAHINSARFSPDGERLVTASSDKTARIWDARLGQPLSEPLQHEGPVISAEFSSDGLRVVTASGADTLIRSLQEPGHLQGIATAPSTVRIWEVPRASVPVPAWLPVLAEAVAGQRVNEQRVMEPLPSDGLEQIRAQVHWHSVTNQYVAWASWFFKEPAKRSLSPCCALPLADHVQRLIDANTVATLDEAVRLAPSNTLALTRLVAALLKDPANLGRLKEADELSLRALDLSPDDPAPWRVRIQVWDRTGRTNGSIQVLDRALARAHADPWLLYGRAWLLEGESRDEALDAYNKAVAAGEAVADNDDFVSRALLRRSKLLEKLDRLSESRADYRRAIRLPPRDPRAADSLIDLSFYYNARLDHPRNRLEPADHLGQMPVGVQRLAEVDFDVRGVVQLSSSKYLVGYYPPEVKGIPISRMANRLHFLHATMWDDPTGTHVATIVIHYAGGPQRSVPIVCGRDVCNWWTVTPVPTHATVVWTGTNPTAARNAQTLRLFKMTWENPEPDREIRALDFRSEGKESAPFLVAITAE